MLNININIINIFLENIISDLLGIAIVPENVVIRFQESEADKGRTDLELTDNKQFYIIIEAKKGWGLPQSDQLTMYSQRKNINIKIYVLRICKQKN